MTDMITPEKLKNPDTDYDADHLAEAIGYAFHTAFMQMPERKSYACECKKCDLTLYTSFKRLNCEYCGSDNPAIFTCRELEG